MAFLSLSHKGKKKRKKSRSKEARRQPRESGKKEDGRTEKTRRRAITPALAMSGKWETVTITSS